jgi:hypothetical protein
MPAPARKPEDRNFTKLMKQLIGVREEMKGMKKMVKQNLMATSRVEEKIGTMVKASPSDFYFPILRCGGEYTRKNPIYTFYQQGNRLVVAINVEGGSSDFVKFKGLGLTIKAWIYDVGGTPLKFDDDISYESQGIWKGDPPLVVLTDYGANETMGTVIFKYNLDNLNWYNKTVYGEFEIPISYGGNIITYTVSTINTGCADCYSGSGTWCNKGGLTILPL